MEQATEKGDSSRVRRPGLDRVLLVVVILLQVAIAVQLVLVSRRQDEIERHLQLSAITADPKPATATTSQELAAREARHTHLSPALAVTAVPDTFTALREAQRAFDDMDTFFAQVFTDFERIEESFNMDDQWQSLLVSPTLDMRESPEAYNVYFSLPNLNPGNVQVLLDGRILTIQAAYAHPLYMSRYGRPATLEKRVQLPGPVGLADQSSAIWTNGALRISVPKARETEAAASSARLF